MEGDIDEELLLRKDFLKFKELVLERVDAVVRSRGVSWAKRYDLYYQLYHDIQMFSEYYPHRWRELTRIPFLNELERKNAAHRKNLAEMLEMLCGKSQKDTDLESSWRPEVNADAWKPPGWSLF